jgi:hypothetical protein
MLSIPHGSVRASTPARDGSMLEIESGRTVAPSETTGATLPSGAAPLSPARDPVNAGRTVRVEWGGRCHACQAPIWAATWPGTRQQAPPRRCPDCGGAPVFRAWRVLQAPLGAIETRVNGDIAGWNGAPSGTRLNSGDSIRVS